MGLSYVGLAVLHAKHVAISPFTVQSRCLTGLHASGRLCIQVTIYDGAMFHKAGRSCDGCSHWNTRPQRPLFATTAAASQAQAQIS